MKLTSSISKRNFYLLLLHAGFLAFAQVFMDVDTIIPDHSIKRLEELLPQNLQ
jgi:hypothetical protein